MKSSSFLLDMAKLCCGNKSIPKSQWLNTSILHVQRGLARVRRRLCHLVVAALENIDSKVTADIEKNGGGVLVPKCLEPELIFLLTVYSLKLVTCFQPNCKGSREM